MASCNGKAEPSGEKPRLPATTSSAEPSLKSSAFAQLFTRRTQRTITPTWHAVNFILAVIPVGIVWWYLEGTRKELERKGVYDEGKDASHGIGSRRAAPGESQAAVSQRAEGPVSSQHSAAAGLLAARVLLMHGDVLALQKRVTTLEKQAGAQSRLSSTVMSDKEKKESVENESRERRRNEDAASPPAKSAPLPLTSQESHAAPTKEEERAVAAVRHK